jgi:hypothetical protein
VGLKAARFVAIVTCGLAAGVALCHVLELPNKLALPGPAWFFVQKNLYRGFALYSGPLELVALASALYATVLVRGRRGMFALSLAAVLAIAVELIVWLAVVNPVHVTLADEIALPIAWRQLRFRWELGQALRATLLFAALVLLVLGTLGESRTEPDTTA